MVHKFTDLSGLITGRLYQFKFGVHVVKSGDTPSNHRFFTVMSRVIGNGDKSEAVRNKWPKHQAQSLKCA
jgi:hypothetical protein